MKTMSYSYKLLLFASLLLTTNSLKAIEGFSLIPAGAFTMGDSLDGILDAPTHSVTLDAFYMGKYEVTKAEWDEVRNWALSKGYTDLAIGSGKAGNHPVHSISWYDMVKWCNARSEKEGFKPVYYTDGAKTMIYRTGIADLTNAHVNWNASGYRLPTEAEWEKAARGGLGGKRFPWGDTISHSQANYYAVSGYSYDLSGYVNNFHPSYATGGDPYTSPVGALAENGYGIYDMAGNVWEACWDRYGALTLNNQISPPGSDSGAYRIFRGGSWANAASTCRVAFRSSDNPTSSAYNYGFRVVRKQTIDGDYVGNFSAATAPIAQAVHDCSGRLELKVSDSGAYTGSLVIYGIQLGLKGKFNDDRYAEFDIKPNKKKKIAGALRQVE